MPELILPSKDPSTFSFLPTSCCLECLGEQVIGNCQLPEMLMFLFLLFYKIMRQISSADCCINIHIKNQWEVPKSIRASKAWPTWKQERDHTSAPGLCCFGLEHSYWPTWEQSWQHHHSQVMVYFKKEEVYDLRAWAYSKAKGEPLIPTVPQDAYPLVGRLLLVRMGSKHHCFWALVLLLAFRKGFYTL